MTTVSTITDFKVWLEVLMLLLEASNQKEHTPKSVCRPDNPFPA